MISFYAVLVASTCYLIDSTIEDELLSSEDEEEEDELDEELEDELLEEDSEDSSTYDTIERDYSTFWIIESR